MARFSLWWAPGVGMDYNTAAILNELRIRMYSDEGTLVGRPGLRLWEIAFEEYRDWLIRQN